MSLFTSLYQRVAGQPDYNRTATLVPFRRGVYLTYAAIGICFLVFLYELQPFRSHASWPSVIGSGKASTPFDGQWNPRRDRMNLLLNDAECSAAFPGLDFDIERAVRDRRGRRITIEELEEVPKINGYIRGMIYNQELFVIDKQGGIYSRELATLNALYRAIVTSPDPLPNIEFTFISDDRVASRATWGYARKSEDTALWLIPDFGFWAWPETKVGSYNVVQQKAMVMEDGDALSGRLPLPFQSKQDKLVWRGATMNLELRKKFLAETQDKAWSDVKEIMWHDDKSMQDDLLSMEDHCKYKFVAHTEGNSYSGRLKYLQNCRSVVVAHTMDWIQHYQHLMVSSGPEQNFVEVGKDFADLEDKMTYLLLNPEVAEKIADQSVHIFRERYLTPAAQTCYWRKLIHAWASIAFEPQRWGTDGKQRGVSYEDYVLERRLDWDPY